MVIAMLPPSSHERLSSGRTARNQAASSGIAAIGAANRDARRIRAARRSRGRSKVLMTMQPTSAPSVVDTAVRNRSDGQKLEEPGPHAAAIEPAAGRELPGED